MHGVRQMGLRWMRCCPDGCDVLMIILADEEHDQALA